MERHYKPYLAMLFIQLIYAGMALFSKAAISNGMNPYVFVVYRQALAFLALSPLAFYVERNNFTPLTFSLLIKIFMVSFSGLTMALNLFYTAINYTTATFASASTNTIPAITFLIAVVLRMESVSIRKLHGAAKVLGSIVGVSGALVFAFVKGPLIQFIRNGEGRNHTSPSTHSSKSEDSVKGILIMIASNTLWAFWLILQGSLVKQYPSKLRLTTLQCFFSCIQSAVWAVAVERDPSQWKLGWNYQLLSVVYCGVVVTGITYWLQVWAIEKKGPVFTAMFTPLALVITVFFSAIFWKETYYLGSVLGATLMVCGLYSVLWGKTKEEGGKAEEKVTQCTGSKEETMSDFIHV